MTTASLLTLLSGGSYAQREAAIAASLLKFPADQTKAVILEGLPDGANALPELPSLQVHRIAPGCMCCIGNLALRVTLNRVLRHTPAMLYLSLSSTEHVEKIIQFLQQAAYQDLLTLDQHIQIPANSSGD